MGASAGPSLQGIGRGGASNLVLEMDAHDAKSYPGEPTTSLLDNPISSWSDNGAVTTTSNVMFGGELFVRKCVNTATGSSSPGLWPIDGGTTVLASTQYTLSIRGFQNVTTGGGNAYLYVQNQSLGSDLLWTGAAFPNEEEYFSDPSQQIASSTFTTPAGTTLIRVGVLFAGMSTTGGIFYIKDLQLEQKGYATPFVREGKGGTGTYNARPATTNLMIHGNVGTGQSFSDSSPSKHTITANGNVTHSGGQSKFSGGSIYFDGTGDYLDVAASTGFAFGTGDFTVDAFVYTDNTTADSYYRRIYMTDGPTGNDATNPQLAIVPTTGLANAWSTSGSLDLSSTTNVADGAWHHIAMVRRSGTVTLYVDGASEATQSWTENVALNSGSPRPRIGSYDGSTGDFDGYIDEVRVTTGTALWISAFTPPTRRNLSAPVVDRSGNDNGGNFNTTDMTDVSTYRVGEVIRPIDSAVWDFDGTDDRIECSTDPFDLKCFELAIQQYQAVAPDGGMGGYYSNVGFTINNGASSPNDWKNGLNIGSWTGGMTDETVSWWGYGTGGYWATYIKDTIPVGWHIYTFNWNGSSYDIWIDGVKKTTYHMTAPAALFQDVITVSLGVNQGWDYWFKGKMGCVRCYDISLTDQQVKENFNQQRNRFGV